MGLPCRANALASRQLSEPRLVEPRDGAELAGGSLVAIEWAGDLSPDVLEWEAFLSVDGAAGSPHAITPHLDAGIRRFTFDVPNVTATNARILFRFGDEKGEREVNVPSRFTIRFDPAAVRTRIAFSRGYGESARPGSRAVAQCVTRCARRLGTPDVRSPRELVQRVARRNRDCAR